MRVDYFRSYEDEPHLSRRKRILEKYPEIKNLFGPDPRPIPYVIALVFAQLTLSYYQQFWSWPVFLIVAWSFGGTASQALLLMAHELSHNLVFESVRMNDFFGIFCNIGNGFPSATMFKRYHMEHHMFQGNLKSNHGVIFWIPNAYDIDFHDIRWRRLWYRYSDSPWGSNLHNYSTETSLDDDSIRFLRNQTYSHATERVQKNRYS